MTKNLKGLLVGGGVACLLLWMARRARQAHTATSPSLGSPSPVPLQPALTPGSDEIVTREKVDSLASSTACVAEVVLKVGRLQEMIDFMESIGFRLNVIFPADDPRVGCLCGHGMKIRLVVQSPHVETSQIRLYCADEATAATIAANNADSTLWVNPNSPAVGESGEKQGTIDGLFSVNAPNGTVFVLCVEAEPVHLPVLQPALVHGTVDEVFGEGRAGMMYRDLIPCRLGGRFIASHISIPKGGPVADYVHYHAVRFQVIFCVSGWVRVVYEGQGGPFVLRAGDCVLQPPLIRHRVLEASDNLDVVEIGCPAEHKTIREHDMTLPTSTHYPPTHVFGQDVVFSPPCPNWKGQLFAHHIAAESAWHPHPAQTRPSASSQFEAQDLQIRSATFGLADVRVIRKTETGVQCVGEGVWLPLAHESEFLLIFVLSGHLLLNDDAHSRQIRLRKFESVVLPAKANDAARTYIMTQCSLDLKFLQIAVLGS